MIDRRGAAAPLAALLLAGCGAAEPSEIATLPGAPVLRIEATAANLIIIPEQRTDLAVEAPPAAGLTVTRQGDTVRVTGGARPDTAGRGQCGGSAPPVVVRAPRAVQIIARGGVSGRIGAADSVRLSNQGCGGWRIAAVLGQAVVAQSGPGSVSLGAARALTAQVHGRGRVEAAEVAGSLAGSVAGPGEITVRGGVSPKARLRLEGSGDIVHAGQVGTLDAELSGSGRIHAAVVTGQVRKVVGGAGQVTWGRPAGRAFCGGSACSR
ncbi:hypothetical protein [Phenylobacterium sp.]|jgi:cytoskeletal protein CcmA (bactofilin family)|uniref:hypothetical protein n=1 Tax=Phenylobacterium sp. TaxID=1871053 RepID=UPI002E361E77|nr:hypothetical protein [Phenylobacterium sp.]HEX2559512.1 hypothetical protein [Phenylobacterium sp.]